MHRQENKRIVSTRCSGPFSPHGRCWSLFSLPQLRTMSVETPVCQFIIRNSRYPTLNHRQNKTTPNTTTTTTVNQFVIQEYACVSFLCWRLWRIHVGPRWTGACESGQGKRDVHVSQKRWNPNSKAGPARPPLFPLSLTPTPTHTYMHGLQNAEMILLKPLSTISHGSEHYDL